MMIKLWLELQSIIKKVGWLVLGRSVIISTKKAGSYTSMPLSEHLLIFMLNNIFSTPLGATSKLPGVEVLVVCSTQKLPLF